MIPVKKTASMQSMQRLIYMFVLLQINVISETSASRVDQSKACEGLEQVFLKFAESVTARFDHTDRLLQSIQLVKGYKITDAAFRKQTEQSSTHENLLTAGCAVDGNQNTFSATNNEMYPYWWVDLTQIHTISKIEIINRKDCCGERLHDLDINVGSTLHEMTLCAHYKGPSYNGEHLVFTCQTESRGRYVKMMIKGTEIIQLAEVKVFVPAI